MKTMLGFCPSAAGAFCARAATAKSEVSAYKISLVFMVRWLSSLQCPVAHLRHRLRFGEGPCAVQDFGTRTIEAHQVIPARHGRQAVGDLAVAAAELDGNRAIVAFLRGDAVE